MTKIQVRGKWFVDEEAPPTRERVEPVAWANVYDGGMALYGNEADARCYANANALETAAPLYRHPATIDDAIALLVRSGWVEKTRFLNEGSPTLWTVPGFDKDPKPIRVLIAPTPERAS